MSHTAGKKDGGVKLEDEDLEMMRIAEFVSIAKEAERIGEVGLVTSVASSPYECAVEGGGARTGE